MGIGTPKEGRKCRSTAAAGSGWQFAPENAIDKTKKAAQHVRRLSSSREPASRASLPTQCVLSQSSTAWSRSVQYSTEYRASTRARGLGMLGKVPTGSRSDTSASAGRDMTTPRRFRGHRTTVLEAGPPTP